MGGMIYGGGNSISSLTKKYATRIIEFEGEKWRCSNFSRDTVVLDFLNVPGEPRDDRILRIPRKVFFECLLERKKGGNT